MSNEKQIIAKLVKLAEKQQKIINKLAQVAGGVDPTMKNFARKLVSMAPGAAGIEVAGARVHGTDLSIDLQPGADKTVIQQIGDYVNTIVSKGAKAPDGTTILSRS